VAAPAIVLQLFDNASLHRIQMDVTDHRTQILVSIDKNGLVAAAKQGAIPAMVPIESLGINPIT
jgi:hypothetical protein